MRHLLALPAIVLAAIGVAGVGGAQEITPRPTPATPSCARPNAPARVVRAMEPETPPMAQQQDIHGTVQVVVSLDTDGHVVGTRIQSSPSAILNAAAMSAARQSTFQAQIRDCQPIAADYLLSVDFARPVTFSVAASGERFVSVTGDGDARRAPDSAAVLSTVLTRDAVAANASAQNDALFESLKAKVSALGTKMGVIGSVVSVRQNRPAAEAAGYIAIRQVTITADSVANAVHVAAAVTAQAGVEGVEIRYTLNDYAPALRDAQTEALNDAARVAREAVTSKGLHLGVRRDYVVPPDDHASAPYRIVPFALVPVIGGFREPEIRIPYIPVHATVTATYAIKP